MSLSAERFQTRGSILAKLVSGGSSDDGDFHSRKLGINLSLQQLGVSSSTINDLIEIYGIGTARAVGRVGQRYMTARGLEPDIPNLAEVIHRFGENYAMREVAINGTEPYDVLNNQKRTRDGMILH